MHGPPPPLPPPGGPPPGPGLQVGGADYPPAPPSEWPAWAPTRPLGGVVSPAPPPPASGGRGRAIGIAALVVVLLLAVVGAALIATSGDDDEPVAAPPTTSATTEAEPPAGPGLQPSDPTLPSFPGLEPGLPDGLGPDPQEMARPLAEVLPEIISFVERQRGHRFLTTPVVEAVPEAEFEERLGEAVAEEEDALAEEQVVDQALGLIPPGTDLVELSRSAAAAGVLGYYLPGDGELLVKGDVVTPLVQTVIAHELTHALDDQLFDLSRIDALVEQPDESAFGLTALVEGTARWVENAFAAQLSAEEQAAVEAETLSLGFDQLLELADVPPVYLVEGQVPYGSGARLVTAIVDDGGIPALDAAYRAPPTTSEQVLDPAVYEAGEPAAELAVPPADAAPVDDGALGSVDLRLMGLAGDPTALFGPAGSGELDPVEGFGGGRYVSWRDGDRACVRFWVTGDDAAGDAAVRAAVDQWMSTTSADARYGDPVTSPAGRPVLSVLSCA